MMYLTRHTFHGDVAAPRVRAMAPGSILRRSIASYNVAAGGIASLAAMRHEIPAALVLFA